MLHQGSDHTVSRRDALLRGAGAMAVFAGVLPAAVSPAAALPSADEAGESGGGGHPSDQATGTTGADAAGAGATGASGVEGGGPGTNAIAASGSGPASAGPRGGGPGDGGPGDGRADGVWLPESVAGVAIPDSRLARAAATLAHGASPQPLFNHVMRSYLFAALLFDQRDVRYDRELAFVGCALHDLGLVDAYMSPDERFEVDGADAARRFLDEWHVPRRRSDVVWDAIALHTMSGIAVRKSPEIAMVSLGAGMDAGGANLDQLSPTAVDAVLAAFPRLGFKQASIQTIVSLCEKKPFAQLLHPFAEVGRRHVPDFPVPTVADLILAAPFPE